MVNNTNEIERIKLCAYCNMAQILSLLIKPNILDKDILDGDKYLVRNSENKELRDRLALLRKETILLEKLINDRKGLIWEEYYNARQV